VKGAEGTVDPDNVARPARQGTACLLQEGKLRKLESRARKARAEKLELDKGFQSHHLSFRKRRSWRLCSSLSCLAREAAAGRGPAAGRKSAPDGAPSGRGQVAICRSLAPSLLGTVGACAEERLYMTHRSPDRAAETPQRCIYLCLSVPVRAYVYLSISISITITISTVTITFPM